MSDREHWNGRYEANAPDALGWFEAKPELSLLLVERLALPEGARVLDVGTGATGLVGWLPRTFDRTAVELSAEGLRMARERLGEGADEIRWIEGDVLRTELGGPFDLWHDRAVFHFLLEEEERRLYRQAVARSLRPGGHMILATFAEDGPERCSGLPVRRYSPAQLALEWEGLLEPIDAIRHVHRTPTGREQRYVYALMRRPAAED